MALRGSKWKGRPNLGQIEEQAIQKVSDFRRKLQLAGLSVPEIPPVPVEYMALTLTELSLRSVADLAYEGKPLSGLLDMERAELLYEERDVVGRQNFTVAHELGHYFLHYLPAVEMARQPTLFDTLERPHLDFMRFEPTDKPAARFFRCGELAVAPGTSEDESEEGRPVAVRSLRRDDLDDPTAKARLAKIIRLKELSDRAEWEANVFASGLLMPSELVRWLNKKHAGDVSAMAAELNVTPTALRYRLNGLGLRQDDDKGLGANYNAGKNRPDRAAQQGTFF